MRQELTLRANVQGGYDDNVTGGLGTGAGTLPTAMISGATANANATLAYFLGNGRHSIRMGASGSLTGYPENLEDPAPGGTLDVGAMTTVGRNTTFEVSERVGYEPFFNVYSPGASGSLLPPGTSEAVPAAGLFERNSLSTDTMASVEQRWSRWNSMSLSYSYRTQEFMDDDYGDYSSQEAKVELPAKPGERGQSSCRIRIQTDRLHRLCICRAADTRAQNRWRPRIFQGAVPPQATDALPGRRSQLHRGDRLDTGQPYTTWLPTGSVDATLTLSPAVDARRRLPARFVPAAGHHRRGVHD